MPGEILTCEVCGREGRAIPCKNFKHCQQGRCPICFVTILETPDAWSQVWSIQLTCESCCCYGSRCLVDDKDLPSLSSQALGKALQRQNSSKPAVEKRQHPSADGQVLPSKRSKGSPALAKPTPPQLSVEQEAAPAAAAASRNAATQGGKLAGPGSEVKRKSVKHTPPSESRQLAAKRAAAAATAAAKNTGKQQPVNFKRPPDAAAKAEEQPPPKRQASEQQQSNKQASNKGGITTGDSSDAGAAAAAAALQAKVAANSGLQRPLSGSGLLSKSRTTGTLGSVQQIVAASGGGVGLSMRDTSLTQQRQQQAPGSGSQLVAAAKLGQSKPGQSRPGGSSFGPSSTEELGKVGSKQQAAGGVLKQPLQPLRPTPSNSQDQQRQHNHVKQQELTPQSRVQAFPTVSPSPQKSAISPAKATPGTVAQLAAAQPKAREQQQANVHDKNRQQLEKLRQKKQQQLEKEEQQQQKLAKKQHARQHSASEEKQKAQQPPLMAAIHKSAVGFGASIKVACPASGKHERVATAETTYGKATSHVVASDVGTHAASAAKLGSGVDAAAVAADGRLQQRGIPSGSAVSSGKQQDSLGSGHHAGAKRPDEGLQQRVAERRHADLMLKQGATQAKPTAGVAGHVVGEGVHTSSTTVVAGARPALGERQQQRQQTAAPAQRAGFSLVKTVQNIGGSMGFTERDTPEDGADDGFVQADAQAPAAASDAPKRKSAPHISCHIMVNSESKFWGLEDAKFEVLLGQLPLLLAQQQASARYTGSITLRNVLDSMEGYEAGATVGAPDFSRVTVILREPAFGGKKELPSLIETLVKGSKYVRIEHGGQKMYLAPVLKQWEDDKELVDYDTFTLGRLDDVWTRVYDDRLGVFSYLKPGEQPASKLAGVKGAVPPPRLWNPQLPPERPSLRQSSLDVMVRGGIASVSSLEPLAALPAPVPAQAPNNSFMGDDDDLFGHHDHDEHTGVANVGGFGVGMAHQTPNLAGFGAGMGSGGLGVGMGSGSLGPSMGVGLIGAIGASPTDEGANFMEQDAYEDALNFEPPPRTRSMPAQQAKEDYSMSLGVGQEQPQPQAQLGLHDPASVKSVAGGSEEKKKKTRSVHFADANGGITGVANQQQPSLVAPPPAAHEARALGPQASLEKQARLSSNVITQVVQSHTPCKMLLPSLSGLCKYINEHGIKGLRIHLDTSLTQHARSKARDLSKWLREQGAIVTETIPAPSARKVQVLLVSKQWVLSQGLEGRSSHFRLIEYLIAGTHVMTESFVEALKAGKLVVEDLQEERSHVQVFAEGVHLLWDATLLRGSTSAELAELVRSIEEAGARLGGVQHKQRFKAWVMSKDRGNAREHFSHLSGWLDSKIVDTLPNTYISSSKEMVKTAAKAIHIMNKDMFPLRYMMVVVPDPDVSAAQQKLTEDDWRYIGALVLAANNQKTICAATRTQAIQFLNLLR